METSNPIVKRIHIEFQRKQSFDATSETVVCDYFESITIDRKTDTIQQVQRYSPECEIKREYHIAYGVSEFLDENACVFSNHKEDKESLKTSSTINNNYSIIVDYENRPQLLISGTVDNSGLPDDYPDFSTELLRFIRFYGDGELLNPISMEMDTFEDLLICRVMFSGGTKEYYYLTKDKSICIGDFVIVPVGEYNRAEVATVTDIKKYFEKRVPFPRDEIKYIIRKMFDDEVFNSVDFDYGVRDQFGNRVGPSMFCSEGLPDKSRFIIHVISADYNGVKILTRFVEDNADKLEARIRVTAITDNPKAPIIVNRYSSNVTAFSKIMPSTGAGLDGDGYNNIAALNEMQSSIIPRLEKADFNIIVGSLAKSYNEVEFLASLCRKRKLPFMIISFMPFLFEGKRVINKVYDALDRLFLCGDLAVVINEESYLLDEKRSNKSINAHEALYKIVSDTILFLCDTESEEDLQGAAKAIKSQYHIVTREERLAEYDKRENNRN